MRKPQPSDIVRCLPGQSLDFYLIVERIDSCGMIAPIWQEGTNIHWNEEGDEIYRPAPHEDGDYIVTDQDEYDRIWADYCAWRLTGEA